MAAPRVIEVRLRDLPRSVREQLLFVIASDADKDVRFTVESEWTCASYADVSASHPAVAVMMAHYARLAEVGAPTIEELVAIRARPSMEPRTLRSQARSSSRGRSPSPMGRSSSPTLRRGEQRTVQWASRLVEEFFASCSRTGVDRLSYSDVVDMSRTWMATRCGLASMAAEQHADLLNATHAYRAWCPTCAIFDEFRERNISFEHLETVAKWRALITPHVVTESQKVHAGDVHGFQIVMRRYVKLEAVADVVKKLLDGHPRSVVARSKAGVIRLVKQGSDAQRAVAAAAVRPEERDTLVFDRGLLQAFDNPGFVDVYALLRQLAVPPADLPEQRAERFDATGWPQDEASHSWRTNRPVGQSRPPPGETSRYRDPHGPSLLSTSQVEPQPSPIRAVPSHRVGDAHPTYDAPAPTRLPTYEAQIDAIMRDHDAALARRTQTPRDGASPPSKQRKTPSSPTSLASDTSLLRPRSDATADRRQPVPMQTQRMAPPSIAPSGRNREADAAVDRGGWSRALEVAQQRVSGALHGMARVDANHEDSRTRTDGRTFAPLPHSEDVALTTDEADLFCALTESLEKHKPSDPKAQAVADLTADALQAADEFERMLKSIASPAGLLSPAAPYQRGDPRRDPLPAAAPPPRQDLTSPTPLERLALS